jgi:hypothetical protein
MKAVARIDGIDVKLTITVRYTGTVPLDKRRLDTLAEVVGEFAQGYADDTLKCLRFAGEP